MLGLDMYRRPFHLFLPDNQSLYRSFIGTVLSLITIISLITIFLLGVIDLYSNENYVIRVHEVEDYFEIDDSFGFEDGFIVAAAVTAFDGSSDDLTDLSIGRLKFVRKSFDSSRT